MQSSSELEHTPCHLCGAELPIPFCERGQFGLATHVAVCERCGFSYLDPRWTKLRYDRFYLQEYDRYYRPEVIAANDERYRFEPIKKIVQRLQQMGMMRPFPAVLDLGSGMGHALAYLRDLQHGAIYEAIEPSTACREHMLNEGLTHISSDVNSDWDVTRNARYDLVIMRHVLEHFPEPQAVLRKVREVLKEDGLLYVAVPDALHPTRPLRGHFFRVVHISYFTERSLNSMLRSAGLDVIRSVSSDDLDRHEVYAICRKGPVLPPTIDPEEFRRQIMAYRKAGALDWYYGPKAALIALLRKLHILS